MKNHLNHTLAALLSLALLPAVGGCKDEEVEEPEVEETTGVEVTETEEIEVEEEIVEEPCSFAMVYFAFNSSELDSSARAAIQEAVQCYRGQNPNVQLLLTGATDPRGTEEYNLALGEVCLELKHSETHTQIQKGKKDSEQARVLHMLG